MTDNRQTEIDENLEYFLKELPTLAVYHGKFALIRHKKIVNYFDTPMDALKAATSMYSDKLFSIQQVTDVATNLGYYSHAMPVGNSQ